MADDIRVVIATPQHRDGLVEMARYFIAGEPVSIATDTKWEDVKEKWVQMIDEIVQYPFSHIAVTSTNQVVGFRLSRVLEVEKYRPEDSIYEFVYPGIIRNAVDYMTKNWSKFLVNDKGEPYKRVLQFLALSVHPDFGGRGLGEKMCKANLAMGEQLGCECCLVIASNWMSQRIFEKLGFRDVVSISFDEFTDKSGEKIPPSKDPKQKGWKAYIKKLGD